MRQSIRKKLLTAFLTIIALFMAVVGLTAVYNQHAYYKNQQMVAVITVEMDGLNSLSYALESALMPANDYIITGDKRYEGEFKKKSEEIERLLREAEHIVSLNVEENPKAVKEESEILRDVRVSWKNIGAISSRVFALQRPVGGPVDARLMEEMDYKRGREAAKRLARWHEIEAEELKEAVDEIHAARSRSWLIMGAAFVILIAGGAYFASLFAKRFVRPIRELHNGAERIAGGDFDFRVDVKTGDEIEQLAHHFNAMATRLKESYSALEKRVLDRTRELEERLRELERFKTVAIGREVRMKELRDELRALREKARRFEKQG
ncbi:MAG: HAMP domain-containing protein [Deltaproteobacteria bacterium]|nr:HAMP domain-containing protein [Deltaproteobacteria bacterium]